MPSTAPLPLQLAPPLASESVNAISPSQHQPASAVEVQTNGATAAEIGPVTALIDPALGGSISSADGLFSLQIPAAAYSDMLSLSLIAAGPSTAAANLQINGEFYALQVLDSAGNLVTDFAQPLVLVIVPPPGVDSSTITVAVLDPTSGVLAPQKLQLIPDGTLSVDLSSIAAPAYVQLPSADTITADAAAVESSP